MKILGFYLIYSLIFILSLLPLRILYLLSDLLCLLLYYIVRYRKRVVFDNLRHAFPEKNEQEITTIAKAFYRHFCDLIFETIKITHISEKQLDKRFKYKNTEILDHYFKQGKSLVLISGHYGNWEWTLGLPPKIRHYALPVYKPLSDDRFDLLIKNIRSKFINNGEVIPMNLVYKKALEYISKGKHFVMYFLGDQTAPKNYPLWIGFLNRETPFYSGPEKIARKFGCPVIFVDIRKIKRGYYLTEFTVLFDDPKHTAENEISFTHVKTLEKVIREKPEYWLWSHRRWKHTREPST